MIGDGSDGAAAADPARGCRQVTQRSWIVLLDLDIYCMTRTSTCMDFEKLHDSDINQYSPLFVPQQCISVAAAGGFLA